MKSVDELRSYVLSTRIGSALLWVAFAGSLASAIQAATVGQWNTAFWAALCVGWIIMFRSGHTLLIAQNDLLHEQKQAMALQQQQIRELLTTLENIARRSNGN